MLDKEYDDELFGDYEGRARRRLGRILRALCFVVLAVAFVVFMVWTLLYLHDKPHFHLEDVTIYEFNISQPNLLSSKLQVTLSSLNLDTNGIFFDRLNIFASYGNQEVTLAKLLPPTYKEQMEVTMWSPVLIGSAVPLTPYLSSALHDDLLAGMVLLNIKIDGWVRWKVPSWVSGHYRLHVNCPVYIKVPEAVSGPEFKHQFAQPCVVT